MSNKLEDRIKHSCLFILCLCISTTAYSQINGKVIDCNGDPLNAVSIYIKGTSLGTTTNGEGNYVLDISKPGTYNLVFQSLGYDIVLKEQKIESFPYRLDITLKEQSIELSEVILTKNDNPANRIIRKAIENRKINKNKTSQYEADFYSKHVSRIKNAPERFMGQDLGDFGGALDSTRSGVLYLSETKSEITYQSPNQFKEKILASKISGDDNGFSFNNASDINLSFYENIVNLNTNIISPIGDNAFAYYEYAMEGTFYDSNGFLINKIKVTPKRQKDRVGQGFLYIVEDTWSLYGVDLQFSSDQLQIPGLKELQWQQNFNFNSTQGLWLLHSQIIDYVFSILGFNINGTFTGVYSNYNLSPDLVKGTFTPEVVSFENSANKKDSLFWRETRPIPLTLEESFDYKVKDSIKIIRESRKYLDSLDKRSNSAKFWNLFTEYTYTNSFEKWLLTIKSPALDIWFNTIQGWTVGTKGEFLKWNDDTGKLWQVKSRISYGFSDSRLRSDGLVSYRLNRQSRPTFSLAGGIRLTQFNREEPINNFVNTVATYFWKDNYLKAYDLSFVKLGFSDEIANGVQLNTSLSYEWRRALLNNEEDEKYTSNNPLKPDDFLTLPFDYHQLFIGELGFKFNFAQKYIQYPTYKFNIPSDRYPSLYLRTRYGFGANDPNYNFIQLETSLDQNFNIANIGRSGYKLRAGKFILEDELSFADFQHFNGNQTGVGTSSDYLNSFNLLPYYEFSTDGSYLEGHWEHNFQGFLIGKVPGLNLLNWNLVVGAHLLSTTDNKPYQEFSIGMDNIGWGAFRLLRFDYVRSYQGGFREEGFIFGLKFLEVLNGE